jgi:hypothetical protein
MELRAGFLSARRDQKIFMSSASELFAQSSSFQRQVAPARGVRSGMDLGEAAPPFRVCANVPIGGGIEISMLPVFVASEDDAVRLPSGQFV